MSDHISEDDLKLLAMSDAEIEQMSKKFCFDRVEFSAKIRTGEPWHQLMQCHLYLEHVIDQMLREAIPYPEEVSFSRMAFRQRLDLTRALDLVPVELASSIRHVTKMRNNVAHNLSFEITLQNVRDLENCTPMHLRTAILEGLDRQGTSIELFELLEVILFMTEVKRQKHVVGRLRDRRSQTDLRMLLDRTAKSSRLP